MSVKTCLIGSLTRINFSVVSTDRSMSSDTIIIVCRVKKARFVGVQAQQFNTYVTLKLQNVKSTTVTVKGANPCWEQDFLFETNDVNTGLLVEVWSKGMLWDRALGYHYIPLPDVSYSNEVTTKSNPRQVPLDKRQQESSDTILDTNSNTQLPEVMDTDGSGQWVSLDSELEMRGGEVVGTKSPTGHTLLIDCRFELPFGKCDPPTGWKALLTSETAMKLRASRPTCGSDPENTEAADLQRKLEMLNNTMDQEARAEQARRQILYNIGHSGYSEDSDYTSDLNYPVGGQGANSSASQFRTAANQLATPQRSLETSRENSYERDDHQIPPTVGGRLAPGSYGGCSGRGHSPRYDEPYPEEGPPARYSIQPSAESSEPLFYNSRPRHYKEHRRRKHTWDHEDSQEGWYSEGYDYPARIDTDTRIFSDTEYYPGTTTSISSRKRATHRRRSLERQTTLYDEHSHYMTDEYGTDTHVGKMSATYPDCQTDIRYNEYYDSITGYVYQDERYGQDDEDRQWDSGGKWYSESSTYYENKRNRKSLSRRPSSTIGIHRPDFRPAFQRQRSYDSEEVDPSGQISRRRSALQSQHWPMPRMERTGKKLPPTPTKPSSVILGRKPTSLPATPGRQLPKTWSNAEDTYYQKSEFNEDYNYAYDSQDNLPQDSYVDPAYQDSFDQSGKENYSSSLQDQYNYDQVGYGYVAPQVEDTYLQDSYKDEYQQPYQESYQNAYTKDQEFTEAKNQYDRSQTRIHENYPDYDENNQMYTQHPTSVSSTTYDQNNQASDVYNQYSEDQYDSQYNVTTSTSYEERYQDNYEQIPVSVSDDYQESYMKQQEDTSDYQVPYSKEEKVDYQEENIYKDTYSDQYQNYREQYDDSYNESYDSHYNEPTVAHAGRRQSEVPELSVTTPKGQTRTNGYPSGESEYFYPSQDSQEVSSVSSSRTKKLGKASPLLQQNTDSLESRDDELKDSFDTAVSSVGSSQQRKAFSEYSTAGDSSPAAATLVDFPQAPVQGQTTMVNHMTSNHVSANVTTTALVHTTVMANGKRLARTDSYHEDIMDDEEYPEIEPKEVHRKDSQMSHQSQISQQSNHSQKPKLTRGDSYASDHFADEPYTAPGRKDSFTQPTRKDSYSSINQEGFKPPLNRTDSYQKRELTRGSSYGQNFNALQPVSRAESYQRGYFNDQESINEPEIVLSNTVNGEYKMRDETLERYERGEEALIRVSRENSLVEPYKGTPPISRSDSPPGSVTKQASLEESVQMDTPPRSPPEPPGDEELLNLVGAAPVPTQLKERTEMTARQRWGWAYNKIIMQLNIILVEIIRVDDLDEDETGWFEVLVKERTVRCPSEDSR
ncbi:uncharacterized protein LOC107272002 [Cephus cinctus]|uniref:Uncharacterized protein LOC107272002 n=1 Tax=Cephus cinctus TaxID=211228 RepID=A0AAJ7W593_CEPCN|nr:uncharacterized protein LOC107272002 [Cephus cinctus]